VHVSRWCKDSCDCVSSQLDYCNSIVYGTSSSNLNKVRHVQNALARTVTMAIKHDHMTSVVAHLHWLPVTARIQFQIALKTLTTRHPSYIHSSHAARHDNSGPPVTTCLKFLGWEPVSLNAVSPTALHASGTVYLTSSLATWMSQQRLSKRNSKRFITLTAKCRSTRLPCLGFVICMTYTWRVKSCIIIIIIICFFVTVVDHWEFLSKWVNFKVHKK